MSVNIVEPTYLTVREWTDFMTTNLEQFGNLGRLESDDMWKEWGERLLTMPGLAGSIVPDPYQFDDWKVWASRLVGNLSVMP